MSYTKITLLLFFLLNYILTIVMIYLLIRQTKIKTISDALVYLRKNRKFGFFLIGLFNLIGLPPLPGFFLKYHLFTYFLPKYSIYVYIIVVFFSVGLFLYYTNLLTFLDKPRQSERSWYPDYLNNDMEYVFFILYLFALFSMFNTAMLFTIV